VILAPRWPPGGPRRGSPPPQRLPRLRAPADLLARGETCGRGAPLAYAAGDGPERPAAPHPRRASLPARPSDGSPGANLPQDPPPVSPARRRPNRRPTPGRNTDPATPCRTTPRSTTDESGPSGPTLRAAPCARGRPPQALRLRGRPRRPGPRDEGTRKALGVSLDALTAGGRRIAPTQPAGRVMAPRSRPCADAIIVPSRRGRRLVDRVLPRAFGPSPRAREEMTRPAAGDRPGAETGQSSRRTTG